MEEILIKFALPISTALLSYIGSIYKNKSEIRKQAEINKTEILKIKEQNKGEIEKLRVQLELDSKLNENNAQTNFVVDVINRYMENPEKTDASLRALAKIPNNFKTYSANPKHRKKGK